MMMMIYIQLVITLVVSVNSYQIIRKYHHSMILYSNNKKIEIALKIKRLQQLKEDGKGYHEYIDEQRRYDVLNKIKVDTDNMIQSVNITDKIKQMERVVTYKQNKQTNDYSNNNIEENLRMLLNQLRIAFLPDVGYNEKCRFFYKHLATKGLASSFINFIDMPDITELNTKRYEQQWMNYMRNLNLNNNYDIVIGHGTSADALIRYLESEKLKFAIFIDVADIYTAGERHGRSYLYSRIRDNCQKFRVIALSKKGANDALTIRNELDPSIYNIDPIIDNYDAIDDYESMTEKVMDIIANAIRSAF